MSRASDILNLIRLSEAQAAASLQRALIIQPGALGDCILTLPLAEFMKRALHLTKIDMLSNTEYTGILPGRTCIDSVRSLNSVELHRLFMEAHEFELDDPDPLIRDFADYEWIISFMGEAGSQFERNLIFTANCSRGVEVIMLRLKAPENFTGHISSFYIQQLLEQNVLFEFQEPQTCPSGITQTIFENVVLNMSKTDRKFGQTLLNEKGIGKAEKLILIHPGSGSLEKCWHIENFCNIAEKLKSKGAEILFILGPTEMDKFAHETINILKDTAFCLSGLSLSEVLGLMSCADLFLGNDSGITHLAASLGVKTIAVFGPTNPAIYSPIGPAVTVFKSEDSSFSKKPSTKMQQEICDVLLV